MNDLKYIQYLVERFLDGLTTLDEEHEIESFIKANRRNLSSMPEDVQIVAEMFEQLQAMDRPSRIKRVTLLWRWAAAAVVAIAVAFGVLLHSRAPQQDPEWQSVTVLIVKASRNVEAIAVDSDNEDVRNTQSVTRPVSKNKRNVSRKKQSDDSPDAPSEPMQADAIILDVPTRMPMAATEFIPVVSDRKELEEVILECELKILEDKYQAYASERRTIKI